MADQRLTVFQSRPRFWLSFGVWVATFTIRIIVLRRFVSSPDFVPNGDDMKFYSDWAARIIGGELTDGRAFYGLPGYAWLLAGLGQLGGLLGNVSPRDLSFFVGFLQAALDATTALLIFRIGTWAFQEANPNEAAERDWTGVTIGLLAALGWAAFIPAQAFSLVLMPTAWLVVIFWGLLWWIVKTTSSSKAVSWLGIGAAIGVTAMLVATVLFLLPLALFRIALSVATDHPRPHRAATVAVAISLLFAGVFVGCAPAWIHNYFVAHERVLLSAHSGLNFYIGNNPIATGYPKIPPGLSANQEGLLRDSITLAEKEAGRRLKRAEVSAHWAAKAKAWIHQHPAEWRRLMMRKFANFWNAFQYDDLSIISLLQSQGVIPRVGLRFGGVAALALPGLIYGAWRFPRARWIAAAVILHLAALMPVFVTERYRLCAIPGLLIFASYGLWQLWRWLLESRALASLAWIIAVAVSASFVSISRGDIGLWSLDHFNTGIRALKTGDFAAAQHSLERAYAYVQDNAEINFALGTLWQQQDNAARATFFYKRTVDLDPLHASAWSNLGLIAFDQKNFAQAVRFFQRSIEHGPDDAKTHFLLARTLFEDGDQEGARRAIRRALELRPEQAEFQALRAEVEAP